MSLKQTIEAEAVDAQEAVFRSVAQHTAPYMTKLKGIDFVMFPEVFNPNYARASLFFLEHLGVHKGDAVLDPFTGSGADAIFAVMQGAEKAVTIDKFVMPVLCAKYNTHMLGIGDKVDVRQGDLFDALQEGEKFDLVLANPPFKAMKAENPIFAAMQDRNYETLTRFFEEVRDYLTPEGRIRMVFANIGDIKKMEKIAKQNGFKPQIVAQDKYASEIRINVYEMIK